MINYKKLERELQYSDYALRRAVERAEASEHEVAELRKRRIELERENAEHRTNWERACMDNAELREDRERLKRVLNLCRDHIKATEADEAASNAEHGGAALARALIAAARLEGEG